MRAERQLLCLFIQPVQVTDAGEYVQGQLPRDDASSARWLMGGGFAAKVAAAWRQQVNVCPCMRPLVQSWPRQGKLFSHLSLQVEQTGLLAELKHALE